MPFLTTAEIAQQLRVRPATVRWRLLFMRRLGIIPTPEQIAHGRGRWRAYRADFVAVLRQRFPA